MARIGQSSSSRRDALQKALPRLYKFALVLTANEELARALLRGTVRALNGRFDLGEEDGDRLTGVFRRMYAIWSAKLAEDPAVQKKCPPDARVFSGALSKGPMAGNVHLPRFVANLSSEQRAVLYLVYGEGASYDEAAEVTGLNMLALMRLLARGHSALMHWLDRRGLSDESPRLEADPYLEHENAA